MKSKKEKKKCLHVRAQRATKGGKGDQECTKGKKTRKNAKRFSKKSKKLLKECLRGRAWRVTKGGEEGSRPYWKQQQISMKK